MDLNYLSGADVEANIASLMKTPKDILKRTADVLGYTKKKKIKEIILDGMIHIRGAPV